MIKTAVARRYAKALFGLVQPSDLDATRAGLTALAQTVDQSKSLKHVVASPAFTFHEKHGVLVALVEQLGCPPIVSRFLGQLIKKNRLRSLGEIAEEFVRLVDELKGTRQVQVRSAKSLNDSEQEQVRRRLREVMRQEVDVLFQTDPALLAGLQIRVGSTVFDSSVRSRLSAMRTFVTKE